MLSIDLWPPNLLQFGYSALRKIRMNALSENGLNKIDKSLLSQRFIALLWRNLGKGELHRPRATV